MALIKAKPTSPGRRFVVSVKTPGLHTGKPYAALVEKKSKTGGRNNAGRITTRHIGGGHKQRYRVIDFKRSKDGIDAVADQYGVKYSRSRMADSPLGYSIAHPTDILLLDSEGQVVEAILHDTDTPHLLGRIRDLLYASD